MTTPRSVMHVVPSSRPNPWLADAIRAADPSRWRHHVVSVAPAGEVQREMAGIAEGVHTLGAAGREALPSAAIRLARLARQHRIDLLHGHLFEANLVSGAACRMVRVPLVITRHEPPDFMRLAPLPAWKRQAHLAIDGAVLRSADAVVAPSRRSADELRRFGVMQRRIHAIPLGLDLERIALAAPRPATNASEGRTTVGMFGRLSWEKSIDTALRAWPAVLARRPDALLLLVGDGPLRTALADLARDLGIDASVRFTGWRDDVPAIMSAVDVVLHTSRTESTGMVLLEALARARPLVVTPVGIVGEQLRDGQHCLVVPHEDAGAASAAVLRLLDDASLAGSLAERGRACVLEGFATSSMISAYAALYERLLEVT